MKLHELKSKTQYKHFKKVGRGIAGKGGKTAGRGTKGQKARTGYKIPRRFEGGQVSLIQRLPKKRGFKNLKKSVVAIRADRLFSHFKASEEISPKILFSKKLITNPNLKVKIIGNSDIKKIEDTLKNYKFSNCIFSKSIEKLVSVKTETKPKEKITKK